MFLWCPDFGGKWGRPRQSFYLRGARGSHMMDRNRARAEDQTWYECDIAIWELRTSTCFMHDWLTSTREVQPKGRKGLKTECKWWSEEGVLSIHRIPFVCGMRQTSTTMMIGKRKNTLVRHQIRRMESWRITQFQIANWSFSPPKLTFDAMILDPPSACYALPTHEGCASPQFPCPGTSPTPRGGTWVVELSWKFPRTFFFGVCQK